MKLSLNSKCPCGSRLKYKKCCFVYHDGVNAGDALKLMVTRYSAYAARDSSYIMRTTHPSNKEYMEDRKAWAKEIERFCDSTEFLGLNVTDFEEGENEAFVTFAAKLSNGSFTEKSRFVKENGVWLYESGKFLDS